MDRKTIERRVQIKAFEDRLGMCASDGWKDLMEEIEEFIKTINVVDGINTLEELYIRKGKLELFRWLENLRDNTTRDYETLMESKDADF